EQAKRSQLQLPAAGTPGSWSWLRFACSAPHSPSLERGCRRCDCEGFASILSLASRCFQSRPQTPPENSAMGRNSDTNYIVLLFQCIAIRPQTLSPAHFTPAGRLSPILRLQTARSPRFTRNLLTITSGFRAVKHETVKITLGGPSFARRRVGLPFPFGSTSSLAS